MDTTSPFPYYVDASMIRIAFPTVLSSDEVFYIDDTGDNAANKFILNNLEIITSCFEKRHRHFIHAKHLIHQLSSNAEVMRYRQPVGRIPRPKDLTMSNNWLLNFMVHPENRYKVAKPAFIMPEIYGTIYNGMQIVHRYEFDPSECDNVEEYISRFVDYIIENSKSRALYHLANDLEARFDTYANKLIKEVNDKLFELRASGVSDYVLRDIFFPDPKPSRMVITADHRIVLPDFNDMEIEMTPLVKAVFFLFMRHPEGIRLKTLHDHRHELAMLYACIKEHRPLEKKVTPVLHLDENIERLVNPLDNSIHEKCARIKEAFLLRFHNDIACNYYVDGPRGEPKGITLDRDLLTWE